MFPSLQEQTITAQIKRQETINEKKETIKKLQRETAIMIFQTADMEFTPVQYLNDYEKLGKKQQKLYIEQG